MDLKEIQDKLNSMQTFRQCTIPSRHFCFCQYYTTPIYKAQSEHFRVNTGDGDMRTVPNVLQRNQSRSVKLW